MPLESLHPILQASFQVEYPELTYLPSVAQAIESYIHYNTAPNGLWDTVSKILYFTVQLFFTLFGASNESRVYSIVSAKLLHHLDASDNLNLFMSTGDREIFIKKNTQYIMNSWVQIQEGDLSAVNPFIKNAFLPHFSGEVERVKAAIERLNTSILEAKLKITEELKRVTGNLHVNFQYAQDPNNLQNFDLKPLFVNLTRLVQLVQPGNSPIHPLMFGDQTVKEFVEAQVAHRAPQIAYDIARRSDFANDLDKEKAILETLGKFSPTNVDLQTFQHVADNIISMLELEKIFSDIKDRAGGALQSYEIFKTQFDKDLNIPLSWIKKGYLDLLAQSVSFDFMTQTPKNSIETLSSRLGPTRATNLVLSAWATATAEDLRINRNNPTVIDSAIRVFEEIAALLKEAQEADLN